MNDRDVIAGFIEVSSGRSTCSPNKKGPDIRSCGVTPKSGRVVMKAENLPERQDCIKRVRLEA